MPENEHSFLPDQESRLTPEQKERFEQLINLQDKDLFDPNTAGYHGTTLTAYKMLIERGSIPGRPGNAGAENVSPPGSLYFFPSEAYMRERENAEQGNAPIREARYHDIPEIERAAGYGKFMAEDVILFEVARLDSTKGESHIIASELSASFAYGVTPETVQKCLNIPWRREMLGKVGLDDPIRLKEVMTQVKAKAEDYQGVVFALHKDIFEDFEIHDGDEGDDKFIIVPDGLLLKYISGVRLVGKGEQQYRKDLETQLK